MSAVLAWANVPYSRTDGFTKELEECGSQMPISNPPQIFRLMMFRKLTCLNDITDERIFIRAWQECLRCHLELWIRGIHHGDISVWNLMWDDSPEKKCGVLNDFDPSVIKGETREQETRGGQHTGTLPFMARQTLDDPFATGTVKRRYDHEFESFIWVFAWLCLRGVDSATLGLAEWRKGSGYRAIAAKDHFIRRLGRHQVTPVQYSAAWERCKLLFLLLTRLDSLNTDRESLSIPDELPSPLFIYEEAIKITTLTTAYGKAEEKAVVKKFREITDQYW